MSIQEHLNKIRNAVYGREVRESIAKGIETAYDDASEKDNANMEVKIARGTHPNLRSRLDETTAQLAQTETSKVDKDGSGQVKWSNIAQDAREQISGEKVAVVGDDSIITTNLTNQVVKNSKIDNGAVTPRTTSFIKESTNLYNKETVVEGKRLDGNGNIINDGAWSYSERIPVLPGQKYYMKYIGMYLCMNQDGSANHLRELYDQGTGRIVTVPDNIYYIVPIVRTNLLANDVQISLGETAIPFEPYYNRLDSKVQMPYEDVISNLTNQEFEAMQDEFGGKNLLKNSLDFTKTTTEKPFYFWLDDGDRYTEKLEEGVTYTLSFDLKATVPTYSDRIYMNGRLTIDKHFDFPVEWKKQYVTFTYDGDLEGRNFQIRPTFYPEASGSYSVRRVKLVKGVDENLTYRPSPEEYSVITQIDVDSYKEDIIDSVLKRIEIIDSELKDIGNDIPVSEMYKSKQPNGMLGAWTEINGVSGIGLENITIGYDDNLYFHLGTHIYKLEDLSGTPEAGVSLSGLGMGSIRMVAVFPSGVVYVTNNTDEDNEPCAQVWKAPDYETAPTLLHTLKGDKTEALATKSQYNGVQEVITICQYSQDVFRDNSAFVSFDGGETIKKVKTVQGASSGANRHYHTMHWDFYQNRLWLGEGDTDSNRSIWYSDDIGETWDRIDSNEYQPTLIESFPNRVIFGRDNYIHLPGFWSFERPKNHDDLNKEIKLVDRLSFETVPESTAITYYPERMGFAQEGLVAYHCFEKQSSGDRPSYFYATGDGGQSWHCVLISQDEMRGAFIKDGHLISLRRADSQLMKTPLLEWE